MRHFPHHGSDGAVDLPHLRNALSRAPQSPFGDRALPHLRRHASSEGVGESADSHSHEHADDPADLPYAEHLERVLAAVARLATRSGEREEVLAKEGRRLSAATRRHLSELMEQMHTIRGQLEQLLAEDEPEPKRADLAAIRAELERFAFRHRDVVGTLG